MTIVGDREFYYNRFTSSGMRYRGINIDYNKNAFAEDVVQNYEVREQKISIFYKFSMQ